MREPDRPGVMRRRLLIAGAALPAACAAPAWQTAPVAAPAGLAPERLPRGGERWRYALTNVYNGAPAGVAVAEALPGGPPARVRLAREDGTAIGEEVWAGPGLLAADAGYDMPIAFEQPLPVHPPTLAVGWSDLRNARYQVVGYERWYWWQAQSRALAWETVVVPAGRFTCLRVERFIRFEHADVFRLDPTRRETLWFAPGLGRFVRREWTGEYFWAGRRRAPINEDWVRWELIGHVAAPVS